MNKQKKIEQLWILFIILILVNVVGSLLVNFIATKDISFSIELSLVISELLILLPGLIYVVKEKLSLKDDLGFTKIKLGTVFMTILLSYMLMPVVAFVNVLSQFFVSNTMIQATDTFAGGNSFFVVVLSSFVAPFCEEFVFRGVFDRQIGKYASATCAMLASAVMFGLMHLNVNQMCYAFVLGIIMMIVNRASGSIFTSLIIHVVINLSNMLMLLATNAFYSSNDINFSEAAEGVRTSDMMYVIAGVYFVLAIIFTLTCIPCVVFIAKHEDHFDDLKSLFTRKKKLTGEAGDENEESAEVLSDEEQKVRVFMNVPAIVAIVLCLFIIFGFELVMKALGLA